MNGFPIEKENGVLDFLDIEEFKMLISDPIEPVQAELIVVSIPNAETLGQELKSIGVKNIIIFRQKDSQLRIPNDEVKIDTMLKISREIQAFCVKFFILFIQNEDVEQSFQATKAFYTDIDIEPALISQDIKKDIQVQEEVKKTKIPLGPMQDTSSIKGPTNLEQDIRLTPFTGRSIEMNQIMQLLSDQQRAIIHMYGLKGVGKTRILVELSYYLNQRQKFGNGLYIINCRNCSDLESIRVKIFKVSKLPLDIQKPYSIKSILLILENVDQLVSLKLITEFSKLIGEISLNCSVIFTTRKYIRHFELNHQKIELKHLSNDESMDLALNILYKSRQVHDEIIIVKQDESMKPQQQALRITEIQALHHSFQQLLDNGLDIPLAVKNEMMRLCKSHCRSTQKEPESYQPGLKKKINSTQDPHLKRLISIQQYPLEAITEDDASSSAQTLQQQSSQEMQSMPKNSFINEKECFPIHRVSQFERAHEDGKEYKGSKGKHNNKKYPKLPSTKEEQKKKKKREQQKLAKSMKKSQSCSELLKLYIDK